MRYLLLFLLFTCSCHKKEKHGVRWRALYAQPLFAQLCEHTAKSEEKLASFKSDPLFNLMGENASYEEGLRAWKLLSNHFPSLSEHIEAIRSNDILGAPQTYEYGEWGRFSPNTLKTLAFVAKAQKRVGGFSDKHLLQIGGGYGEMCYLIHALFSCASYTIVDFPPQLELAKVYLSRLGIDRVTFHSIDDLPTEKHFDCILSSHFVQFDRSEQQVLLDRLLKPIASGCLEGVCIPQHYGVSPFAASALQKVLVKQNKHPVLDLFDGGSYEIFWNLETTNRLLK